MKIRDIQVRHERIGLARPYEVAYGSADEADLFFVRIETETGLAGLGSAAPLQPVTGETVADCRAALSASRLQPLTGRELKRDSLEALLGEEFPDAPAARAALDMAFFDLLAKEAGTPLVDYLGRCHTGLPTSVTIGIKSSAETLDEAQEHVDRGFRCLKIKVGRCFDEDVNRLKTLREQVGREICVRIDANQGYSLRETRALAELALQLDLELIEQPLPPSEFDGMRGLPASLRKIVAADESLLNADDALRLSVGPAACGVFNVKIMKCGGIAPALSISRIAQKANLELMWGCSDESVISIAAALHAAYACSATRYLDLDGSLDLVRDPARGGFILREGVLYLSEAPGLGVEWIEGEPAV